MARKKNTSLAHADPTGRIDVMLYRLAGRGLEEFERAHNLTGVRESFLPIFEQFINAAKIPKRNLIPAELMDALRVIAQNSERLA